MGDLQGLPQGTNNNASNNVGLPCNNSSHKEGRLEQDCGNQLIVTLKSAQGLKDVCMFGTMSPYAKAWIDPQDKHSTPVARSGGKAPVWDSKISLTLQPHHLSSGNAALSIQIFNRGLTHDTLIGGVSIPLQDVVGNKEEFMACQLLRPSGRIHGVVNLSVQWLQRDSCSAAKMDQQCSNNGGHGSTPRDVHIPVNKEALMLHTRNSSNSFQHEGHDATSSVQVPQRCVSGQQGRENFEQWHQDPSDYLEKDHSPFDDQSWNVDVEEHSALLHSNAAATIRNLDENASSQHLLGQEHEGVANNRHPRRHLSENFFEAAPDDLDFVSRSEQGHAPLPDGRAGGVAQVSSVDSNATSDPLGVGIGVTGGSLGAAILIEATMIDAAAIDNADAGQFF